MKLNHLKPDQILLHLLNELSMTERKAVDDHLSTCQKCKTLLEREGEFIQQLRNQPYQEPENSILTRCRDRLNNQLREEVNLKNQKKPWFNIGEILTIRIPIKQLAAATIIFLLGLVFGRFLFWTGIIVGAFVPRFIVNIMKGRRLKKFNDQLGDTINLLVNGIRSGYSMPQAMETVARDITQRQVTGKRKPEIQISVLS